MSLTKVSYSMITGAPANVIDYGADPTGAADSTAAIQAAIDANDLTFIPVGTYRIDGTVQARDFKTTILEGNLLRDATYSASTTPIWQFNCQRAVLTGSGQLTSENDSPEGIVLFGSQNPASLPNQSNVLWCELSGVFVVGNQNPYVSNNSKGVAFRSIEAFGGAQVVYTNLVTNVCILACSDLLYFGGQCNANVCSNIQFYRAGRYSIYINGDDATTNPGTSNNQVSNFFVNFSGTSQAVMYVVRSFQAMFVGASGEPGGSICRFYDIDGNSQRTVIVGADNCPAGPVDLSPNSGIFSSGQERIEFGTAKDYYRGAQIQARRTYNPGYNPVGPGNFFLQALNESTQTQAWSSLWLGVEGVGNTSAATLYAIDAGSGATEAAFTLRNGGTEQEAWHVDTSIRVGFGTSTPTEKVDIVGNLKVSGSVSKGSGSFKIDHPLESKSETHHLVHSFVEAPQADNIYRGKATLVNGRAQVNIDEVAGMTDGTFVALNREVQCFTSNESDWDAVRGFVAGNILTIESQNPEAASMVSWLVIGERCDKHMYDTEWTDEDGKVIVEPLKIVETREAFAPLVQPVEEVVKTGRTYF
jgi:hypothetical protein